MEKRILLLRASVVLIRQEVVKGRKKEVKGPLEILSLVLFTSSIQR